VDELEEEMRAQRHKELVQKFFTHMQTVDTTTVELAKEIKDSEELPRILKEMFLTIMVGILRVLRDGAQVLDLYAEWVDKELEGTQDVFGDERPDETA
jgi:hypothetical protein